MHIMYHMLGRQAEPPGDAPFRAADVRLTSTVPINPVTPVMSQVLPRMKPSMLSSSDRAAADGEVDWWPFVAETRPFSSENTSLAAGPGARQV